MKKTIDVCDECQSPYVEIIDGDEAYCPSCALSKYDIAIINTSKCEKCGTDMHSYDRLYLTKYGIGVYCSLRCAVNAMKED